MRTNYRIDDFQETYFVVNDLDELLDLAKIDFSPVYAQVQGQPDYAPGQMIASDTLLARGTGRYHDSKRAKK